MRKLVILLGVVGLLAAGCGGGGGGGTTTTAAPLTKPEYQAKLAEIAKQVRDQLGTTSQSFDKLTTSQVDQLVAALHSFAAKLQAVSPPPAIKPLHVRLIGAMNDLADEFPDIAANLKKAKDPSAGIAALFGAKGIQELIKLGADFKKAGYNLNLNG